MGIIIELREKRICTAHVREFAKGIGVHLSAQSQQSSDHRRTRHHLSFLCFDQISPLIFGLQLHLFFQLFCGLITRICHVLSPILYFDYYIIFFTKLIIYFVFVFILAILSIEINNSVNGRFLCGIHFVLYLYKNLN